MDNRASTRSSRMEFKSYTAFTESKLDLLKNKLNKPGEREFYIIQTTMEIFENEIALFEYYLEEELNSRDDEDVAIPMERSQVEEIENLNLFISSMVIDRSQGDLGRDSPEWHIIYKTIQPSLPKNKDIVMHFKEKIYGWRCLRNLYKTLTDIPSANTFVCGVLQPSAMGHKSLDRHLLEWILWRETQRLNGGILLKDSVDYIETLSNVFKMDSWERSLYQTASEEFMVSDEELTVQHDEPVKGLLKVKRSHEDTRNLQISEPNKSGDSANMKVPLESSCSCQKKETRGIQATESIIDADVMISRIVIRSNFDQEKSAGLVSDSYRRASLRRSLRISSQLPSISSRDSIQSQNDRLGLKNKVSRVSKASSLKISRISRMDNSVDLNLPIEAGVLIITDKNSCKIWENNLAPHFDCEIFNYASDGQWSLTKICELDIIITTFTSLIESKKTADDFFLPSWFRILVDDEELFQWSDDYKIICTLNYYAGYVLTSSNSNHINAEKLYKCFQFLHWPTWNFESMWSMYRQHDMQLYKQIKTALSPIFFSFQFRESINI